MEHHATILPRSNTAGSTKVPKRNESTSNTCKGAGLGQTQGKDFLAAAMSAHRGPVYFSRGFHNSRSSPRTFSPQ